MRMFCRISAGRRPGRGGADRYRGGDGPLHTRKSAFADPLVDAYLAAGAEAGHPTTDDYNGEEQEGFSLAQSTIKNGRRCSAAVAYLRPALSGRNLSVRVAVQVTRVVLRGGRATGVEYFRKSVCSEVHARREVILCAGAINTPHTLMLSGIGDPEELGRHNIKVNCSLPGVGKNLQDHISAPIAYARKEPGPFHRMMRLDRVALELGKAAFLGTGLATDLPSGWIAFLKSSPGLKLPDIQFLFRAFPTGAGPYLPPFMRAFTDGFGCRPVVLRPESRGWLALRSSDPTQPLAIHQNFLATEGDRRTLRTGLRLLRDIADSKMLRPFIDAEVSPGADVRDDEDLDIHVRATAMTAYHPLGTCKMGNERDPESVVDSELRVRGLEALRVVDASVMPDHIGSNINGPVIMIAEKAADMIRGFPGLGPSAIH